MSAKDKTVAVLHQGCVPVYRVEFYELLNQRGALNYEVIHGDAPIGSNLQVGREPFDFPNRRVKNWELAIKGKSLIYQPVVGSFLAGRYAGAVLGHELKYLSHPAIMAACRMRGLPVVFWGFGLEAATGVINAASNEKRYGGMGERIKRLSARGAAAYLAYTEKGKQALLAQGFDEDRVGVLRNTIDMAKQIALWERTRTADLAAARARLGLAPDSVPLLYVGRLILGKNIDLLIEYARRRARSGAHPPVDVMIVGDGDARAMLEETAAGLANVRFYGALPPDSEQLAEMFRLTTALVIPGFVGLAVNHAFAHGAPVITRDLDYHSPEVEYMTDGVNCLFAPEDEAGFFDALDRFVEDPALQQKLAGGALASRDALSLDHMVDTFDRVVRQAVEARA